MTQVKKAYQEIVSLLEANENVKVKTILDQVREMASAKSGRSEGSTFMKDSNGNVVAIFDYYYKRWMPLVGDKTVEFGAKQKTSTGFNTMSKEGVSAWTKQQREAKNANTALLNRVASGEVSPANIAGEQAKIEEARKAIASTELGFADVNELVAYLQQNGVEVTAPTEA